MGKSGWRANRERCLIVNNSTDIPARLAEIVEDFQFAEGREKLEMLLQFSENLPPLPERYAGRLAEMEAVPECMTPVAIAVELIDGGLVYHFAVPEESPTVRGYAAILAEGLRGASPQQVIQLPSDFYLQMGLQNVLTIQRLNGMSGMVAHIKRLAVEKMTA
jgi:cysteine desulfuration protein SufE